MWSVVLEYLTLKYLQSLSKLNWKDKSWEEQIKLNHVSLETNWNY